MSWRDIPALKFFVPSQPASEQEAEREPSAADLRAGSVAWSEFSIIQQDAKYNPDDLIGRKGFDIYKRMMNDEQVKSVMHFKRSTVTGREWYFELDAEKYDVSKTEAKRRVDLFTAMLDTCYSGPLTDGLNAIMKAMWQGFSMTEQIFGQFTHDGKTWWGLRELKPKPFDTFFPHVNENGEVQYWAQRGGMGLREKKIDLEKFVYYRFNPDMDEHYGWSDLRAAYRSYLSKDITIRFRNIFMERLAGGFVVAKPQTDHVLKRDSMEWRALVAILQNITGKSSIILPAGIDLEIMYASGGQVGVFKESIDQDDISIAKAALVPNLIGMTPSGQTGSYSQSDTQFDTFMIISDTEAGRLVNVLNEQVFAPLARVNFQDGIAPRFCFKPLNKRKMQQVLTIWQGLLGAKGVQASDTDEDHVRKLLEFPEKGELLEEPVAPPPSTPPTSTPHMDEGEDDEEEPTGAEDDEEPNAPVGRGEDSDADRDKRKMARRRFHGSPDDPNYPHDDGGGAVRRSARAAFSRAESRVAFSVIARQSDAEVARHVVQIEDAVAEVVADGLKQIGDPRSQPDIGRTFELDPMKMQHIHTWLRRALRAGMDIGTTHSNREVDKAKGEHFSRRLNFARMGELAADWMKSKSFTIAGDVKAGIVKEIRQSLINGLKLNTSEQEIKNDVYRRLVKQGYLGGRTAAEALGAGDTATLRDLLEIKGDLEPYRLSTIVRTNMFEAINEARFNTFTDPALEGFVRALEYSAILDARTTEVCEHMAGRVYSADDWEGDLRPWVPPNHFNCRSILIPVTIADENIELTDDRPSIAPQEGFG